MNGNRRGMRLGTRFALYIFAFGAVVGIGLTLAFSWHTSNSVLAQARLSLMDQAHQVAYFVDTLLAARVELSASIAAVETLVIATNLSNGEFEGLSEATRSATIQDLDTRWRNAESIHEPFVAQYLENIAAQALIRQMEAHPGTFGEIFLTNRFGALIATTGKLTTLAHGHKPWWLAAFNDGRGAVFLDDRGFDASVGGYVLGVVVALKRADEVIGILKCNFSILGAVEAAVETVEHVGSLQVLLVRSNGLVVLGAEGPPLQSAISDELLALISAGNDARTIVTEGEDAVLAACFEVPWTSNTVSERAFGGTRQSIDHRFGNAGESWFVIVSKDINEILAPTRGATMRMALLAAGFTVAMALIALTFGWRAARPVRQLAAQAQAFGSGILDARVHVKSGDEIGRLAKSFNEMASHLASTMVSRDALAEEAGHRRRVEDALRISEEKYRALYENAPLPYQSLDEDGLFLDANPAWLEALGYDREEVIGESFEKFLHPEWRAHFAESFPVFKRRGYIADIQFVMRHKDGHDVAASFEGRSNRGPDGSFVATYCVFRDITEQLRAREALRQSEERYRLIDDASVDYVYSYDLEGRFTHANLALCAALQRPIEDILGKTHAELGFPEAQCAEWDRLHRKVYETQTTVRAQTSTPMPEGIVRFYEVTLNPLLDGTGNIAGIAGATRDITERKLAEDALQESEKQYRLLATNANDVIWMIDLTGRLTYVSPSVERLRGYTPEEVIAAPVSEAFTPESFEIVKGGMERLAKLVAAGDPFSAERKFELEQPCKDGSTVWTEVVASTVHEDDGTLIGILGVGRDISERVRTRNSLRESEFRLRQMADTIGDTFWMTDWETKRTIYASKAYEKTWGRSLQSLYDNPEGWADAIHPEDKDRAWERFVKLGEGETYDEEYRILRPDGEVRWISDRGYPVRDEQGNIARVVGVAQDITERVQREEMLRIKDAAITSSINAIAMTDLEGRQTYVNGAFLRMWGYDREDQVLGMPILAFAEPREDVETAMTALLEKGGWHGESIAVRKDGSTFDVEVLTSMVTSETGEPLSILASFVDVTERKRAEKEKRAMEAHLCQAQKLESIGTLASGVAHEINNPLMGMINYADMIAHEVEDDVAEKYSKVIMEEGNRIAEIVKNLLSFSRQDKERHSLADIRDIVDRSLILVGSLLRRDHIAVHLDIPEDLPQAKCRSQQIEQVIVNLLTNAHDALNERYPAYDENKLIRITAHPFEKDGEAWVRTTVEDHGTGVVDDAAQRIFDPFYTTKPRERGTGLGLSVSYGIAREHHGELSVESVLGEYTRFHMDLPIDNGWATDEAKSGKT